jgi:hypothetical protein
MEEPPPGTPSTDQVTDSLAVNCWVPPGATVADVGETVRLGVVTVTAALAAAFVFTTLVAVTV